MNIQFPFSASSATQMLIAIEQLSEKVAVTQHREACFAEADEKVSWDGALYERSIKRCNDAHAIYDFAKNTLAACSGLLLSSAIISFSATPQIAFLSLTIIGVALGILSTRPSMKRVESICALVSLAMLSALPISLKQAGVIAVSVIGGAGLLSRLPERIRPLANNRRLEEVAISAFGVFACLFLYQMVIIPYAFKAVKVLFGACLVAVPIARYARNRLFLATVPQTILRINKLWHEGLSVETVTLLRNHIDIRKYKNAAETPQGNGRTNTAFGMSMLLFLSPAKLHGRLQGQANPIPSEWQTGWERWKRDKAPNLQEMVCKTLEGDMFHSDVGAFRTELGILR
ncbi:MAG: hypothetical protein H0X51_08190 [Parachlamydiaceae bacterium]|nr:hypothetical protein [Parachlamydiaceae bacterium]